SNSFQFTLAKPAIIKLPTMINAGAVIADNEEIAATIGEKNNVMINKIATTNVVSPVLPPTATPEDDSTYALDGVEPNVAPTVVATASAVNAAFAFGSFPSFIKFACSATPIIVPVVSNIVTSK